MHLIDFYDLTLQDSHCEWLIKAKNDSQFITLKFQSLATECSYDYVFVYDGDSFKSPLLGSFSGKTEPQQVIATSGSVSIFDLSRNFFFEKSIRSMSVENQFHVNMPEKIVKKLSRVRDSRIERQKNDHKSEHSVIHTFMTSDCCVKSFYLFIRLYPFQE